MISDNDVLPLPRGVKPHIMPRYNCPPSTVYYGWNFAHDRFEITCPINRRTGHIWGGFKVARELWNPRNRGWA